MSRTGWVFSGLVAVLTGAASYYGYRRGGDYFNAWVVVAFVLLMIPYFGLGFDRVVDRLRDLGRSNRMRLISMGLLLMLPGLVMLMGQGERIMPRHFIALSAYIVVPILILAGWGAAGSRPTWVDLVVLLLLWLPVELQYFEKVWDLPSVNPSYVLAKTLGMELALFCFVVVRRLDGVGYRFRCAGEDFAVGLTALVVFLALAVPAALFTGFVRFEPHWAGPGKWLLSALGIYFFIALPEEVLFRGLIFNMLQRMIRLGGPYTALVISSAIFGLSHLNNPPADWRYASLATLAGIFYGWAYLRTGSLLASTFTHAMVDIIGRTMFPHTPS